jgi:hypothetical protein
MSNRHKIDRIAESRILESIMAKHKYRSVQINISDAEFARVRKRLFDEKRPLAELMAELIREWLASADGKAGQAYKLSPMEQFTKDALERAGHRVIIRNGWPDFACELRDGRKIFVEVKSSLDKMRSQQTLAMEWLTRAGFECFVIGTGKWEGLRKFQNGEFKPVSLDYLGLSANLFDVNSNNLQE